VKPDEAGELIGLIHTNVFADLLLSVVTSIRSLYNIVNIIVIGLIVGCCLVDVVAVMGDVFVLVCNFHVPLALVS
jgi:hypothetical protein